VRLQVASKIELHFQGLFSLAASHVNCCLSCTHDDHCIALYPTRLLLPSSTSTYHTTDRNMVILWTASTAVWSVIPENPMPASF